ncbi:cation:proton antiporter [Roseivivax isoporae]|uniref:Cation/H+ exchanger transmembrane domain-containing protein n=1 Tax=Roseivivax isoporae LMG 25204 TaxID=1449351 RepID=X7F8C8_9RHOB|nr:cation:proton antiporter [Roseivivax isoporae]ETX29015.1 hypothetical protein RISW2_03480 [Roseivivax isoporae LMG 25204]
MDQITLALALVGLVVVCLGLVSARVETLPVSKPLLALGAGIAVGPVGLGVLRPGEWAEGHTILREAARYTLAISVFGIALRTPPGNYRRLLRPVALLLSVGMLVMWLVSAGLGWAVLGLSPMSALLVGAVLTPTDPVVSSSIVTGGAATRSLPDRLRSTLSLEAGTNDGLAYPFVLLPLAFLDPPDGMAPLAHWLLDAVLRGVGLAVIVGAVIGMLAARALRVSDDRGWIEEQSLLSMSIALSLGVLATVHLIGSDGILAAFAAGATFNLGIATSEEFETEDVQEAISRLFNLPIFVLFGAVLPWSDWAALGWAGAGLALAVLLLRRPLALAATAPFAGAMVERRDAVFMGWFGPLGVAAIFYALHAEHRLGDPQAWHVTSLAVALSIALHGITAAWGMRRYRTRTPS